MALLNDAPATTARQLASRLQAQGLAVTKSDINSMLYGHRDLFAKQGETPPFWTLRHLSATSPGPAPRARSGRLYPRTGNPA